MRSKNCQCLCSCCWLHRKPHIRSTYGSSAQSLYIQVSALPTHGGLLWKYAWVEVWCMLLTLCALCIVLIACSHNCSTSSSEFQAALCFSNTMGLLPLLHMYTSLLATTKSYSVLPWQWPSWKAKLQSPVSPTMHGVDLLPLLHIHVSLT